MTFHWNTRLPGGLQDRIGAQTVPCFFRTLFPSSLVERWSLWEPTPVHPFNIQYQWRSQEFATGCKVVLFESGRRFPGLAWPCGLNVNRQTPYRTNNHGNPSIFGDSEIRYKMYDFPDTRILCTCMSTALSHLTEPNPFTYLLTYTSCTQSDCLHLNHAVVRHWSATSIVELGLCTVRPTFVVTVVGHAW